MDDPSMETLVLLYLSSLEEEDREGYDASTPGIAEAVDLGEDTLADRVELLSALSDLKHQEYIDEHKRQVEGLTRERNVYSLTAAGSERARSLREEVRSETIEIQSEEGTRTTALGAIDEYVDADAPLVEALAKSSDGTLVLDDAVEPIGDTEFVNRTDELAWLRDRLDLAEAGTAQVAMISGEPGVGKTTLVAELEEVVEDRGGTFLQSRCRRDVDQPYRSLFEAVEGLPEAAANELRAILSERPAYDLRDEEALSAQRSELFNRVSRAIRNLSVDPPIVLFFDDVQWMDPTTAALFGGVADRLDDAPVMLVGACRPTTWSDETLTDRLDGRLTESDARLVLPRLDREASEEVLYGLLGTSTVPDQFVEDVYDLTGGNPLFMRESVTKMLEAGTVDPTLGEYPESREGLHVPAAVERTISSRFDTLDDRTRELLEIGSLVGDAMPRAVLSTAAELDEPSFLDCAGILLGSGVWSISDDGETLYFESGVVRETLRDQLAADRRTTLHHRIATAYEAVRSEIEAGAAAIAYHYHEAGDFEQALASYLDAAEAAESVYAQETALETYSQALDVARTIDDEAAIVTILERMGDTHAILGSYDDARRCFRYVLERTDDAPTVQRMHHRIAETHEKQGSYDQLLDHVEQGLDTADESGDTTAVPELLATKASGLGMTGEREAALDAAGRAAKVAAERRDDLAHAQALRVAGKVHRQHGEIDAARDTLETAVEIARETEDRQELATVLKELGTTQLRAKEYDRALSTYGESYDRYEEIADSHGMAAIHNNMGVIYHYREELGGAREQYEQGIEIADRIDDKQGLTKFYTNLGYIETTAGNFEAALKWGDKAAETAEEIGDRNGIISVHEIRAEVAFYRGELDRSREQARTALEIAEEISDKNRKTGTLYLLGRTQLAQGEIEAAIETFEEGIEIGEAHGITQKAALNRYGVIQAYLAADRTAAAAEQNETIEGTEMVSWESIPPRVAYYRRQGEYEEAAALIEETIEHALDTGQAPLRCRLAYERAKLAVERGDPDAAAAIDDAIDTAEDAGLGLFVDWATDLREAL